MAEHFDVIIVGTGAGGGTLAHILAPSGKRILLRERGTFLTRETDNWDPAPVFVGGKYISADTWYDGDGAGCHQGRSKAIRTTPSGRNVVEHDMPG